MVTKNAELLEKWWEKANQECIHQRYFDISTKTETKGEIPYITLLNPGRGDRLKTKGIMIRSYDEEINRYYKGEPNNFIFGEAYDPYFISINLFPIKVGHLTIMHKDKNRFNSIKRKLEVEDLEIILKFCRDTHFRVWHNMLGVGASKPEREHFQGMPDVFPIEFAKKDSISRYSNVYFMPYYPISNIILSGKKDEKIERSLRLMNLLHEKNIPHSALLINQDIYIIPVKNDIIPGFTGKRGGCEFAGILPVLTDEEFNKAQEIGVNEILKSGGYKKDELNLANLL